MEYREFGRTGWKVSEIGFGAWAIGGSWGDVPENDAIAALNAALDGGVNFIDTADVYGDGRSERLIRRVLSSRDERVYVATKAGRRLNPHSADGYTAANLNAFIDRSLENLGVDSIDLLQLHCPPTDVYYRPEVFAALDDIVASGKVRYYGVSVEKVEEAIKAIEYPNVASVQIIFNMFRQRPADLFFRLAMDRRVAILPRVPLASGLLSGKMSRDSEFASDDHRSFNRDGQAFDRGETFAGVPYEAGLDAVDELRRIKPAGMTMAQFALRWILQFDAVTVTIPGAKNADQATRNAETSGMATIDTETLDSVRAIYRDRIAPLVHHRW
ncbi:MAG: aldo/keto reductase [Spirochaetaceae bacterium]|nr:MAG: aldo/keto reductase [Spirochaetaceae bacterium]